MDNGDDNELFDWYKSKVMQKYVNKQTPYPFEATQIEVNSRIMCCGTTSSGKTQALLHYIRLSPKTFSKILIHRKEHEDIYDMLQGKLKGNVEIHYNSLGSLSTLKRLRETMEDEERVLLILDDYMMELANTNKYPNVADYFVFGRKKNITLFCLSQDYYKIDKVLRNQFTYILLFTLPQQNDIKAVLRQFDTRDKVLEDIYEDATREHLSFLKINTKKVDLVKALPASTRLNELI
jgi:hypothetical protein